MQRMLYVYDIAVYVVPGCLFPPSLSHTLNTLAVGCPCSLGNLLPAIPSQNCHSWCQKSQEVRSAAEGVVYLEHSQAAVKQQLPTALVLVSWVSGHSVHCTTDIIPRRLTRMMS
jgi:hypothetical protein